MGIILGYLEKRCIFLAKNVQKRAKCAQKFVYVQFFMYLCTLFGVIGIHFVLLSQNDKKSINNVKDIYNEKDSLSSCSNYVRFGRICR